MRTSFLRVCRDAAAVSAALGLAACISIESTSTGDFGASERLKKAIADILENSRKSEAAIVGGGPGRIDPALAAFVQRHFSKANEIVLQHAAATRKAIPFIADDYQEKRRDLLDFTLKLEPILTLVDSPAAFAVAFPSGRIVLSQPLAKAFHATDEGYDSALLGILIHEMAHVRDGHAIEQWATADGRNQWASDKALGALASLTAVIPFLSVKYDMGYEVSFKSAKQLTELSEYAADLAAVALLEKNGFEKGGYIAFLKVVHAESTATPATSREPFSWMSGRVGCLDVFSTARIDESLKTIVIGSKEDGDKAIGWLDFTGVHRSARALDNLAELRKQGQAFAAYSDEQLKEMILGHMQRSQFAACAIRTTFPTSRVIDGVLTTPTFDLTLFTPYL